MAIGTIVIVPILIVIVLIGAGLIQRRRAQLAEMELNGVMGGSRAGDQLRMRAAQQQQQLGDSGEDAAPGTAAAVHGLAGYGVRSTRSHVNHPAAAHLRHGVTSGIVRTTTTTTTNNNNNSGGGAELENLPAYELGLPKYEQIVTERRGTATSTETLTNDTTATNATTMTTAAAGAGIDAGVGVGAGAIDTDRARDTSRQHDQAAHPEAEDIGDMRRFVPPSAIASPPTAAVRRTEAIV